MHRIIGVKFAYRFIIVVSVLILSACGQKQSPLEEALDIRRPFGLSWNTSELHSENAMQECHNQIKIIDRLLSGKEAILVLEACISEKLETIFLPKHKIIKPLENGEIGALIKGESDIIWFTYSYLHELHPTAVTRAKKRSHAADLKSVLNKLYGASTAQGYFSEGSKYGLVVKNESEQPCDFWLTQEVGVLLCSERVIYMDGFEMSLSFIRLDNSIYGQALREMVLSSTEYNNGTINLQASIETQDETMSVNQSMDILAEFFDDSFRSCSSKNVAPIETVWSLPAEEKNKLSPVLDNYKGDALAEHAINFANNDLNNLSKHAREKNLIYLFKHAADQGSAIAMNEIGASLFYCYLNVRQDIPNARLWIDKAILGGDVYALKTSAHMHLISDTDIMKSRQKAMKLLEYCTEKEPDICGETLSALQRITNLKGKLE